MLAGQCGVGRSAAGLRPQLWAYGARVEGVLGPEAGPARPDGRREAVSAARARLVGLRWAAANKSLLPSSCVLVGVEGRDGLFCCSVEFDAVGVVASTTSAGALRDALERPSPLSSPLGLARSCRTER
jgi:hypothetical protein